MTFFISCTFFLSLTFNLVIHLHQTDDDADMFRLLSLLSDSWHNFFKKQSFGATWMVDHRPQLRKFHSEATL